MSNFGENFAAGYLAELTASLTAKALEATGRRVRKAISGTEAEQALRRCVHAGLIALLTRASYAAPDEMEQIESIYEAFFSSPDTAKELGSLLQGKPLDLEELADVFEGEGYDEATLPGISFSEAITTFEAAFLLAAAAEPTLQGTIQTAQLLEQTQIQRGLLKALGELVTFLHQARPNSLGVKAGALLAETTDTGKEITYRWLYREGLLEEDEVKTRRDAYLNHLFEVTRQLSLAGVDPKTASDPDAHLYLEAVYTALLTQSNAETETGEQVTLFALLERSELETFSALAQLDRHHRLVLLGDPGSGKSTFANFVTMCLAGELLGRPEAGLLHLTAPIPTSGGQPETSGRQPWSHGTLLPVRVILRDFAARGLPLKNQPVTAECLWSFIASELHASALADYAPHLRNELMERGGLIVFDGLDEVPEAEQRRESIKNAVESFAAAFFRCRILVTSRTYAYQQQSWRLKDFTSVTLAPFNDDQIRHFIDGWYRHVAHVRHQHESDASGRAEQLKRAVFGSERLKELAERPLLLTLMASLHAWRGGTLPDKREELYADTVTLLLESWEKQRIVFDSRGDQVMLPSLAEWLKVDRDQVRRLLNELAFEAHAGQAELTGTADIPEDKIVARLTRLSKNPDVKPVRLVEYLSQRAGILIPHGVGVFTFPHRTFQEYLAACYLTDYDYPNELARLAREEPNRWREITLLAGAKAARGAVSTIWLLIDALTYEEPGKRENIGESWGALLAGQALAEVIDQAQNGPQHGAKLAWLKDRQVEIVRGNSWAPVERATAGRTLARLGDPRETLIDVCEMEFCLVQAGPYRSIPEAQLGESEKERDALSKVEQLTYDYWMCRYPVTNAQYNEFVKAGGYTEQRYWNEAVALGYWSSGKMLPRRGSEIGTIQRDCPPDNGPPFNLPNHPITSISWFEAVAFCRWLTDRMWQRELLPKDWVFVPPIFPEYEKASRGGIDIPVSPHIVSIKHLKEKITSQPVINNYKNPFPLRLYPWGNEYDPNRTNCEENNIGAPSTPGCFSEGNSPYGIEELLGNVWEYLRSLKSEWDRPAVTNIMEARTFQAYGGSYVTSGIYDEHLRVGHARLNSEGIIEVGLRIVAIPGIHNQPLM